MKDMLGLRPLTAVRLKANSALLFVDFIDEENAVASCRVFGDSGPSGEAQLYPLDALRENVPRTSRNADAWQNKAGAAKILCGIGWHRWQAQTFHNRPPVGDIEALACKRCGNFRIPG